MKPKIVIEVRGGMVTTVLANVPVDYVLVDYDNISQGDDIMDLSVSEADEVNEPISALLTGGTDKLLQTRLKQLNF